MASVIAKGRHCPVTRALEVVGERWTLQVVRDLLERERCRFQELLVSLRGISPNTLSARLRRLEDAGVIEKRMYQLNPPRAEYLLTPRGRALGPVVRSLYQWGERHTKRPLH